MARETHKPTAVKVSRLKTPGRYCDGLGLWLQVSVAGTKAWLFRYSRHGRARQMGLGALHSAKRKLGRVNFSRDTIPPSPKGSYLTPGGRQNEVGARAKY